MRLVEQRAEDGNTHDIGFIFESSALPMYKITGDEYFKEVGLRAASILRARLIPTDAGGYISSWGPLDDERGRTSSAIDTMANLPLLLWAADVSGDQSFRVAAELHGQSTKRVFFREDFSSYHAVEYNLPERTRKRGYTFQGYSDDSFWSRGQTWAIYGYTALAKSTGNRAYLDFAEDVSEVYWNSLSALDRVVPYWDMSDPSIPNAAEDSSAAAIAASGFLDLAELHTDEAKKAMYLERAEKTLLELSTGYVTTDESPAWNSTAQLLFNASQAGC